MNSFFFGSPEKQLFGVYHSPGSSSANSKSILLCPPLGHEYIRSYRIIRKLAELLAAAGNHVLRFDWSGHGDSHGALENCSKEMFLHDVQVAGDELRNISSHEKIGIAGIRLGATFAWCATGLADYVNELMLWDPVVNGNRWVTNILSMQQKYFKHPIQFSEDVVEIFGFLYSSKLIDSINTTDLFEETSPKCKNMYLYAECEQTYLLKDRIREMKIPVNSKVFPENHLLWEDPHTFGRVIMASPVIQSISSDVNGSAICTNG